MNTEVKLNLTETEIAWLAGLLEGDGSFYFTMVKSSTGQRNPGNKIQLSMTDKDIVERVAKIFSTTITKLTPNHGSILGKKDYYRTFICGAKSRAIMRAVRPFMGQRKTQEIDKQLAAWDMRMGRNNRKLHNVALFPLNYPANYLRRNRIAI